jgi:hypothetical protein
LPGLVDTTVVVEVASGTQPTLDRTRQFATSNGPALRPDYAMRELLAGKVQQLCDAHNRVMAAENPAEAIVSILKGAGFATRTATAKASSVAAALSRALSSDQPNTSEGLRREVLQSLMIEANMLWRRAKKATFLEATQPLACFPGGALSVDEATGAITGPGNTFGCTKSERCAAAQYLYGHKPELQKLIEALHPSKLGEELSAKQENKSRRAALKELQTRGPRAFRKTYCRALGDAYFAVMAPPGHVVLTTNLVDHVPLCEALNKQAVKP